MNTLLTPVSILEIQQSLLTIGNEDLNLIVDLQRLEQSKSNLLVESYLAHWVLTLWFKVKQNNLSISTPGYTDAEQLHRLGESMPGAFLSLLATTGKIGGIDRANAAKYREKFFLSQQTWPDLVQSDSTFLLCQDSFPSGFPKQLYPSTSPLDVIDSNAFEKIIHKLILSVSPDISIDDQLSKKAASVSVILHELFKNTNDHAVTSYANKIIGDSLRGIYCRFYSEETLNIQLNKSDEHKWNQYERYANAFIKRSTTPLTERQQRINNTLNKKPKFLGILEFSIIDSGSGLSAKWATSDVSNFTPQEQLDNVLHCFTKGYSSVPSGERGFGLWKVLNNLRNLEGMISVRTNGVHAFRQFIVSKEVAMKSNIHGQNIPLEKLYDWNKGFSTQPSQYPSVSGTLISILIPVVTE